MSCELQWIEAAFALSGLVNCFLCGLVYACWTDARRMRKAYDKLDTRKELRAR
jgi:hypothetical protein